MYKEIFNSMDEGIAFCKIVCDPSGEPIDYTYIDINPAFERILGLKRQDVIGNSVFSVLKNISKDTLKRYGEVAFKQIKIKEGKYVEFFKKYFKTTVFSHEIGTFCIVFTDITDLVNSELLLKKYKLLSDHARDVILFIDIDGNILEANNAAVKLYGYTKKELTNMTIFDLRYEEKSYVKNQINQANVKGLLYETNHKTKNCKSIPVEVNSIGTKINNIPMLLSIIRDATDKSKAREDIIRLAYYDSLTNLPNRKFFKDKLEDALQSARRDKVKVSIMFLDIDKFKHVNDIFGHSVGDLLLKEAARRMEKIVPKDTIVARLGGDEFVILQPRVLKDEALKDLAKGINEIIKKTFTFTSLNINVSTSIGISVYPNDGTTSEELMKKADIAMYEVKSIGGNGYKFCSDSH